jgi:hypothetical protein
MNLQKIIRYKHCGEAYISQSSDFLHFGIGNNTVVDSIVIRCLSGVVDVLINPAIDQKHLVIEGSQNAYMNLVVEIVGADCQIGNNGTASVVNRIGNYEFTYVWSTILDIKGVVVFESEDLPLTEVHIPVQYLPGGIYLVEILLEEGIINYNRTFVKM